MGKHIVVSGHVQGVGFRFSAQQKAQEHNLSGWVQNKLDGTVEMEIAGSEARINQFLAIVKAGFHRFIRVDDMQISDTDSLAHDFDGFTIK